jgi:hypothetical protein
MPYSITLRSKNDARITGWYAGNNSRWSTDHKRRKVFDNKHDARAVSHELHGCLCNAKVFNIEVAQDEPSLDVAAPDVPALVEC